MLGWNIYVYQMLPTDSVEKPSENALLGTWVGGISEVEWIEELVKRGRGSDLGGNGYPDRFLLKGKDVVPVLKSHMGSMDHRATINGTKVSEVSSGDYVIVEAWDMS